MPSWLSALGFNVVVAVFVLGVLIFVHELGHFFVAKAVGIGVPRFSMGLGPITPLRWQRGETEYVVSWIPFGGYVKMATAEAGEDGMVESLEGGKGAEGYPPEKLFENKPLWARIAVIVAGVTMNALFAWFVFGARAFVYGTQEDATTSIAYVDSVGLPPAAAALTQLPVGTKVIRINGDTIASLNRLLDAIVDPRSDALHFEFDRAAPIDVAIPGSALEDRAALGSRIAPLLRPIVNDVTGEPASTAGVRPGDEIVRLNGDTVVSWMQLVTGIEQSAGDSITLTVVRADSLVSLSMVPYAGNKPGRTEKVGMIGVSGPRRGPVITERYGLGAAIVKGGKDTGMAVVQVWAAVKGLVLRQISARNLGGVLQIGQMSGEMARLGWNELLGLMALLSVNLAVLNLLPIPVLDGGHLMFLLAEGVKGKPVSMAVRLRLSQVGLVFLIGLMLFALGNDVMRLMGR